MKSITATLRNIRPLMQHTAPPKFQVPSARLFSTRPPNVQRTPEHTETSDEHPAAEQTRHEKAIASDAVEAAASDNMRVLPSTPSEHTKVRELHGD
ncbi:hypothetical protein IW150_006029 [Coemansia sp. RSA 2607]|nr:hypothetical protein IW150_006029 [Coemansia sp. RSA 2607]KAJ2384329.1 hypothetical protein GGI05_005043 [Coemansia sp. RSA 2603]